MKSNILACTMVSLAALSDLASAEALNIQVFNPGHSPVNGVIVYANPLDFPAPDRKAEKIEVSQKNLAFNPFISVTQTDNEVAFTNQDDFTHHIYSISNDNRFSFKLKANHSHDLQPKLAEGQATQIAMGCNIHDWMSGYILVVDTPYFAKTDEQGKLTINLEQAGRYQLTLWHPQLDVQDNQINQTVNIDSDFDLEWELPTTLEVELPEVNEDEFDFLDKY